MRKPSQPLPPPPAPSFKKPKQRTRKSKTPLRATPQQNAPSSTQPANGIPSTLADESPELQRACTEWSKQEENDPGSMASRSNCASPVGLRHRPLLHPLPKSVSATPPSYFELRGIPSPPHTEDCWKRQMTFSSSIRFTPVRGNITGRIPVGTSKNVTGRPTPQSTALASLIRLSLGPDLPCQLERVCHKSALR